MAKVKSIAPAPESGIIAGVGKIAAQFGVSVSTIYRWTSDNGFPLAHLPSGIAVTSVTLIDLWLLGRLKPGRVPKGVKGLRVPLVGIVAPPQVKDHAEQVARTESGGDGRDGEADALLAELHRRKAHSLAD